MSRHHRRSFTEMRRARLAMKWDRLEKLERKNTITEPISVLGLSVSALHGLGQLGIMPADGGNGAMLGRALEAKAASQGPVRAEKAPRLGPIRSRSDRFRRRAKTPRPAAGAPLRTRP